MMIQAFVDRFMRAKPDLIKKFLKERPENYDALFAAVVDVIRDEDDYDTPDPERITVIDHGDYQGSRLFVVGAKGCQPSKYWACLVSYGSCSGCDTFEAIGGYSDDPVTEAQANDYLTLCLHMVQGLKEIA